MARRKPRFIQFKEGKPIYVFNNGFWGQWCCNCKLRHVWFFKVVRAKDPIDDCVEIYGFTDENATALRKFYEKRQKKKKTKN